MSLFSVIYLSELSLISYCMDRLSKPCPPKNTVPVVFQAMIDHLSRDHWSSSWPYCSSALVFADWDGMKEGFCAGV